LKKAAILRTVIGEQAGHHQQSGSVGIKVNQIVREKALITGFSETIGGNMHRVVILPPS
jgi:hypothetical protein